MRSRLAAETSPRYAYCVLAFKPTPVPLVHCDDGTVRVAGTRVLLEIIVGAFRDGATPEEIVQQYPTLTLHAVYAVIPWVLEHAKEVDAYLTERAALAEAVREECERLHPPEGIRARLLARRDRT